MQNDKSVMTITTASGMIIKTTNMYIVQGFHEEHANIEFADGTPVFAKDKPSYSISPKDIYPVWLDEHEKDIIIAHWEKTGMFGSIIRKIHASENTKNTK